MTPATVFRNNSIEVRVDAEGTVYIIDLVTNVMTKTSQCLRKGGGLQMQTDSRVDPMHLGEGLIGWRIGPR